MKQSKCNSFVINFVFVTAEKASAILFAVHIEWYFYRRLGLDRYLTAIKTNNFKH